MTDPNERPSSPIFLLFPFKVIIETNRGLWAWFTRTGRQIGWHMNQPVLETTLHLGPVLIVFGDETRRLSTLADINEETILVTRYYQTIIDQNQESRLEMERFFQRKFFELRQDIECVRAHEEAKELRRENVKAFEAADFH